MGMVRFARSGVVAMMALTWACVQAPKQPAENPSAVQAAALASANTQPGAAAPAPAAGGAAVAPQTEPTAQAAVAARAADAGAPSKADMTAQSKGDAAPEKRAVPGLQAYVKNAKVKNRAVRIETEGTKALKDAMRKNPNLGAVLKAQRKNLADVKSGPGDALPPLPPATAQAQVVVDAGRIGHLCDKADVSQALAATREALTGCYTEVLKTNALAQGTVMLEWFITTAGKAVAVKVHSSTATDKRLVECVLKVHKAATFKPHQGKMCVVRWPVGFVAPK